MIDRAALAVLAGGLCWVVADVALAQAEERLPVYIEDSPAAQELVDQARTMQGQDRLTEAVALLQRVIDEYGAKLMPLRGGLYEEASLWVRRSIRGDEALARVYRQVYEPEAERLLNAAQNPADEAALERVLGRFYLTRPGLEAGLLLAGLSLERADTAAAQSVLDGLALHPDLTAVADRYHRLAATAAILSGDDAALADHHQELEARGNRDALAELDALANQIHPPLRTQHRPAEPVLGPVVESLGQPLWSVATNTPDSNAAKMPYAGPSSAEAYPIVPTADADRLYINEGERLIALDRFGGRELWRYEPERPEMSDVTPLALRLARNFTDRRGACVDGDRVLAVVGEATGWPPRGDNAPAGTELVCLDRQTGARLWQVEPAQIEPGFLKAYFQGTPVVSGERVFALLRRNQTSGFQDAFVAAIDAGTGRPLWRRHISSAVTASRYATTAPPQMTMRNGTLYVSDNLAAVAAIVGRTGSLLWTRVLLDPQQANARGLITGGGDGSMDVLPPVLVEAGLVVPPMTPGGPVVLLDPRTGEELRQVSTADAGPVDYLLPMGSDVVAIGQGAALLDGATLRVKWSRRVREGRGDGPRSQAAVTRDHVLVPTGDRLVVLDRGDGRVVNEVSSAESGNLLALDGQLVVADSQRVRSFMPWDQAYAALTKQANESPVDPGPGLAIAHLAMELDRHAEVVEGVDRALSAIEMALRTLPAERVQPMQDAAFRQVLAFAKANRQAPGELRQQLFERLASLSSSPQQEVAYHLGVGELAEETNHPTEAVEHYQAVLLDDTLASQLHEDQDVIRQASLEAQRRLARLVESADRTVYERYDLMAAQQLRELLAKPPVDPDALIVLARRFPMAGAAPEAMYQAAVAYIAGGRTREAAAQLRLAYRRAVDPATTSQIVGALAELYERDDRPRQALQWLRRVAREHADLQPIRADAPTPIAQWIADLRSTQVLDRVGPFLQLPLGEPRLLTGQLVLPMLQASLEAPDDAVLLRQMGMIRMHGGPDLDMTWERPAPPEWVVLAMSDEQVLLWDEATSQLSALDAGTGEPAWPPIRLSETLEALGDPAQREANRPAEMRQFLQMIDVNAPIVFRNGQPVIERPQPEPGYVIAVGDTVVCVGDRQGALVGIDRHTGRTLWQKLVAIDRVAGVRAEGEMLAIWGSSGIGTDAATGAVQVLDLLTGEMKLPLLEDNDAPQWAGFVGEDLLAAATSNQVTAYRVADGSVVWRRTTTGMPPLTGQGWASPDLIVLGVNESGLLCLDASSGDTVNRFHRFAFPGPGPVPPQLVEDQWQLMSSARAMALGPDGRLQWRDAISTFGDHLVQQLVGERYVVLVSLANDRVGVPAGMLALRNEPALPGNGVGYQLFVVDRGTGAIVAEYGLDAPAGSIELLRGLFLDNHLLLSLGDQTLAIPGAK